MNSLILWSQRLKQCMYHSWTHNPNTKMLHSDIPAYKIGKMQRNKFSNCAAGSGKFCSFPQESKEVRGMRDMCGGPTYPFSSLLRCWMSAQGHQKRSHPAWLQIRIALEATEGCWRWHNGSDYSCSYFSSWHRLWAWRRITSLLDQGMSENCGHYDRSRSTPEPSPRSLGLPVWISRRTNEQYLLPLLERRTDGRTDSVTLPTRRSKNSTRTDAFLPSLCSRAHEISISRRDCK
jgi:hypothetical protein